MSWPGGGGVGAPMLFVSDSDSKRQHVQPCQSSGGGVAGVDAFHIPVFCVSVSELSCEIEIRGHLNWTYNSTKMHHFYYDD